MAIFCLVGCIGGLGMALVYYFSNPSTANEQALLKQVLTILYFFFVSAFTGLIGFGLSVWRKDRIALQASNEKVKTLTDIIETHATKDKELQSAKELAERANQAKSRYLTGISHELRTPLQSIIGYAQLLVQKGGMNEFQNKGLSIIRRNSEYLADLIEGLLNISKIEAGRLDLKRNRIGFIDLIDQIEEIFRPTAAHKNIDFKITRSTKLPEYVFADEKRLRQILINLVSNAIKYTNEGSVEVIIQYRSPLVDIRVCDTGVGIAEENLERIMEPFERVREANVPDVNGTGLGLTITRLLAVIMGGELTVKSQLGQGSEFRVSLLLFETGFEGNAPSFFDGVVGYQGEQKQVLVVDDDPIHRGLVSDILGPLGFRVLEAPDSATARNMLDEKIDLFLLDISMPGEDGNSLARHIREKKRQTPIIMLSADAEELHMQSTETPRVYNSYIIKPMDSQALLIDITQQLGLTWQYEDDTGENHFNAANEDERVDSIAISPEDSSGVSESPSPLALNPLLKEIVAHCDIGYAKGVRNGMAALQDSDWPDAATLVHWNNLVDNHRYAELAKLIKEGRQ